MKYKDIIIYLHINKNRNGNIIRNVQKYVEHSLFLDTQYFWTLSILEHSVFLNTQYFLTLNILENFIRILNFRI